tara:strand:+ start:730 stop:1026 length:297 start_codon:yes stop_codon:yes gene_type:complete
VSKENLKKIDIAKNLSQKTGFSINYSKKIINNLIEIMTQIIKEGNLNIKNIGSFSTVNKKERIGRNPKTKEEFTITSRRTVIFKSSKKLSKNLTKYYE